MRLHLCVLAAACALASGATPCAGHGTPIVVNVVENRLTVSNGLADEKGYADWVFADPDPEAWLTPGPGPSQLSTLPGFDVNGMNPGEPLSLDVISRPDFSRPERPDRWLWHWNAAADAVTLAASDPPLALFSVRGFQPGTELVQEVAPETATLKMFELEATDIGSHEHVVLYRLDDSGPAEAGAYGFFARITSPTYEPSEPFLITLNNGLELAESFQSGALAINSAAGLAADFDVDGEVDGADALEWQRTLGAMGAPREFPAADASLDGVVNAADLAIWQEEFGRVVTYPREEPEPGRVPEPGGFALALAGIVSMPRTRRRRRALLLPLKMAGFGETCHL